MKEVAFVSLFLGFLALVLMAYGSISESNYRSFDCTDYEYLNDNYGNNNQEEIDRCYDDQSTAYDNADLSSTIGYAIMLFSLILMIGSNRLQD
jgi:hypothetical protein